MTKMMTRIMVRSMMTRIIVNDDKDDDGEVSRMMTRI